MGGISGTTPALMQARFGIARFGGTRFGYLDPVNVVVIINGQDRSTAVDSVRISLALNDAPDSASFRVEPEADFSPSPSETVLIGLGSRNNLIFGGQIDPVEYERRQGMGSPWHTVPCVDWQRQFDRRRVTRLWKNLSATQIAIDIVDGHTSGFTRLNVDPNLPTIAHFPAVNAKPTELLRQLAGLIGGGSFIDPYRDVHLFGSAGAVRVTTAPLQITNARISLVNFRHVRNPNQIRTRVIVEGQASKTIAEIGVGESVIPVDSVEMYAEAGGEARVDQNLVAYTGVVASTGGSLVGPGVAPPTPLFVTLQGGAGVDSGDHTYAFTWVTAAGETLLSPYWGAQPGPVAAPVAAPARALAAGSGLGLGTYQYAVTFVVGAGETTPGPSGSIVTDAGIQGPVTFPSASASWFPQETHTGGRYAIGDSVYCRCSYVDINGNETGGSDSNTVTVINFGGNPGSVLFTNLPTPSDPNVVLKRLYLNVNGSFVAYKDLPTDRFADSWFDAGTSGGFPVGGDPARRRVSLSSIPIGPSGTTARKVYRTDVDGSTLKLLTTLADNTTTSFADSTADGSLGATAPSSNTATVNQIALSNIGVGPAGVTSRKIYRTPLLSSTFKLVTTIADNVTTTFLDTVADASLGATAPGGDTSGLTQPTGQINAGSLTLTVAGPGAFSASGGWIRVGDQVVRYTGKSGNNLLLPPLTYVVTPGGQQRPAPTGPLLVTVNYGTTVVEAARLIGVTGIVNPIARGAAVVLRVVRNDLAAQAALALAEGGDGVHEHPIKDDSLNASSAAAVADAELAAFGRALVSADWDSQDVNATVGRRQSIALTGPTVSADLTITGVEISFPYPNAAPMRRVQASSVKLSGLMDVVETE